MRPLLDDSIPARLKRALVNHRVRTAVEMGWLGVKNGELLALASADFDAFVTVDKNLPYQQNLKALPIAVAVLETASNELHFLLPLMPELARRLAALVPRTCLRIGTPS